MNKQTLKYMLMYFNVKYNIRKKTKELEPDSHEPILTAI